jgi:hypothetical protein
MNGKLPKAEIAQIFCRELAEYLKADSGGVLVKDVRERCILSKSRGEALDRRRKKHYSSPGET